MSGDTPTISEDDIADLKDAEREILLSRLWSDVYGLRAELIARESARADPQRAVEFREAGGGALWHLARLLTTIDRYLEHYGTEILAGSASFNIDGLIRLAGWTGEVTAAEARELRYVAARVGQDDRAAFIAAILTPGSWPIVGSVQGAQ